MLQIDGMPSILLYIVLHAASVVVVKDLPFPSPFANKLVISNGEMSTKPEGNLL